MTSLFGWGFGTPAGVESAGKPSPGKRRTQSKSIASGEWQTFCPAGAVKSRQAAIELRNPRNNNIDVVSSSLGNFRNDSFLRSTDCSERSVHPDGGG